MINAIKKLGRYPLTSKTLLESTSAFCLLPSAFCLWRSAIPHSLPYTLLPVPCSLKPRYLYLTSRRIAIIALQTLDGSRILYLLAIPPTPAASFQLIKPTPLSAIQETRGYSIYLHLAAVAHIPLPATHTTETPAPGLAKLNTLSLHSNDRLATYHRGHSEALLAATSTINSGAPSILLRGI